MKTNPIALCLSTLFVGSMFFTACQNEDEIASEFDSTVEESEGLYKINFIPAKTNGEFAKLSADRNANIVRSLADLENIIENYSTPLNSLEKDVLGSFIAEIAFRDGEGIGGMNYSYLKDNLSPEDYHTTMSYFGIDTEESFWPGASTSIGAINAYLAPPGDYVNYYCKSRKTCGPRDNNICTSNC